MGNTENQIMAESSSDAPTARIKPVHNVFEFAENKDGRNIFRCPSPPPNLDRPRQNSAAGEQLTGFRGFEALRESSRFAAGLIDLILIDECILETCSLNPRSFERSSQQISLFKVGIDQIRSA